LAHRRPERDDVARRALPYTVWARITHPSGEYMDGKVAELRLVSKRELRTLFPDASIDRERVLGLTKSWIAVRNDKATSAAKRYP